MSWASQRKFTYIFGLLVFVALILFAFLYPLIFKPTTCFDAKQNGDEVGVDCGGACQKYCSSQIINAKVLWSRAFLVSGTSYNLISYIENQNKTGAVREAEYEFRVYDTDNKLIGRKLGKTFIPPNQRFAVFESRFDAGNLIPKNVTFSFIEPLIWVKKDSITQILPIKADRIILDESGNYPSLTARVNNESIYDLPKFDAIVILYDINKNAINVSKTSQGLIKSNDSKIILFNWPTAFSQTPVNKEVIIQINPFDFGQ